MKKNFKSLIASILAVTMIFALAACGTPGGSPSGNPGSETAPDFVYVSSFQEVKNEDNQAIGASCFTPEGFYTTPSEVVGRREPNEGETEQWEGQFDILAERLVFVSYDGQRTQLEDYEPFAFTPAEGHDGGASMYRLAADAQGNLAAIYQTWESWSDAPADLSPEDPSYWDYEYHYDVNWYVRTMDKSGRTQDTIKLENALEDWSYPSDFAYVDGKSVVAAYDGLHIFGDGGEKRISTDGYIQSLVTLRDGTFCMAYYDNLSNGMKLAVIAPVDEILPADERSVHVVISVLRRVAVVLVNPVNKHPVFVGERLYIGHDAFAQSVVSAVIDEDEASASALRRREYARRRVEALVLEMIAVLQKRRCVFGEGRRADGRQKHEKYKKRRKNTDPRFFHAHASPL